MGLLGTCEHLTSNWCFYKQRLDHDKKPVSTAITSHMWYWKYGRNAENTKCMQHVHKVLLWWAQPAGPQPSWHCNTGAVGEAGCCSGREILQKNWVKKKKRGTAVSTDCAENLLWVKNDREFRLANISLFIHRLQGNRLSSTHSASCTKNSPQEPCMVCKRPL